MKTKIIGICMMTAIALAAGWNINQSKNDVMLSDLALNNVEALASGEGGFDTGSYYITDVTETSHKCHTGGPFSCNLD